VNDEAQQSEQDTPKRGLLTYWTSRSQSVVGRDRRLAQQPIYELVIVKAQLAGLVHHCLGAAAILFLTGCSTERSGTATNTEQADSVARGSGESQDRSQAVPVKKRCAVHGDQMFLGPPEVSTLPFRYYNTSEYELAAKKEFPNVDQKFVIGCLPQLWPKRIRRVKYCEKCRAAEVEWVRAKSGRDSPAQR
jgi:hypothetical protein